MKARVQIPGTNRTFCGKTVKDHVPGPGVMLAEAARKGVKVKHLKMVPNASDLSGLPLTSARKELSQHDLEIVKRAVKLAMSGGYGQVYAWLGEGAKEHWADSIALSIVMACEGSVDTDWVHRLRLAVYFELKLETVDVASPLRMSDLTGSKTS